MTRFCFSCGCIVESEMHHHKIIGFLFEFQCSMKLYHWKTTSYARHKAADELIERVLKNGDKLVEVMIGKYGRPGKMSEGVKVVDLTDVSVVKYLEKSVEFLRDGFGGVLNASADADMMNIRDEMMADMNQALYLFTLK